MKGLKNLFVGNLLFLLLISTIGFSQNKINLLVFSKTEGFRHQSIGAGQTAIKKMAAEKGFSVEFTEDASQFNEKNLEKFQAVIFLNTTGNIFNEDQQGSFERYIQAGGGWVGIHSATDTEYQWPWYNRLAGAWFLDHPMPNNVQNGRFYVTERNAMTAGMPDSFERKDEFYSFKSIQKDIHTVVKIDESTYQGGNNGKDHPISWYHEFDGGRAFYTAMGHTDETYSEPLFLNHLYAGIQYATGGDTPNLIDYSKARPEENRFSKIILAEKLDEPMELTLLDENRVLFIQRKGQVRLYKLNEKELTTIAEIPVSLKYLSAEGRESVAEDGLLGLNKDPNFAKNQWIYLYYSSTKGSYNQLSRFTMKGDELLLDSEVPMLQVETQREQCCHTGGSIEWDAQGNLYLSTGDNTNPHASNGFSPSDERPGRAPWDAQKSSANTNDLRGKILRIHPNPDGTYSIPEGNLFPVGTEKTRPEIYTMGHRNPFRIHVDKHTGYLYWGDVGPDGRTADSLRGPVGYDEVGQARKAGNFGWPHFIGNNQAYTRYDFEKEKSLEKWDANAPKNLSPNNTGLTILPPAQSAFVWYPYGESKEFPLVGSGGRNAMAGPVYYKDDFKGAKRAFPKYYDKKFFEYEWMRGWIMAVTMDEEGNLVSQEKFMPSYKFNNPMDMVFADNGDLYMLEYGSGWFSANDDARLIRIEYNGGNRLPIVNFNQNVFGGVSPLEVRINTTGTQDPDGDELVYSWTVNSADGKYKKSFKTQNLSVQLKNKGEYTISLKVDDQKGGITEKTTNVAVGNEPPQVVVNIPNSNKSFFEANKEFNYEVKVSDKEDGKLGEGIEEDQVSITIDYLAEGFDKNIISAGHRTADQTALFSKGKKLIEGSDCMACHKINGTSIGPSYVKVAAKYKNDQSAMEHLTKKIIAGGSGVWGETAMAGHPQLSTADAAEMVKYILNSDKIQNKKSMAPTGTYMAKTAKDDKGTGVYIIRAAYEDKGANGLPSLQAEENVVLRNAKLDVHSFDEFSDLNKMSFGGNKLLIPAKSGAYTILKKIDLIGLKSVVIMATAPKAQLNSKGGLVEIRIDGINGKKIAQTKFLEASDAAGFMPSILNADINLEGVDTNKAHDLYFIFKNEDSPEGSLFVVMGIEFKL